ncbi:hypothetical protein OG883_03465 [Streptomyces sp. NBC_01142]|uniref:hypothetical protein n=1 Tax=Streptomyces sp. NBC_01142 TaxID=2975865 RepID=UPI00225AC003|nr:hypothetical protein [Streptomyces sp. NBC_01142]MCX4818978.1 hypothetical protein [Streptomyces sp. NBC_01142]
MKADLFILDNVAGALPSGADGASPVTAQRITDRLKPISQAGIPVLVVTYTPKGTGEGMSQLINLPPAKPWDRDLVERILREQPKGGTYTAIAQRYAPEVDRSVETVRHGSGTRSSTSSTSTGAGT